MPRTLNELRDEATAAGICWQDLPRGKEPLMGALAIHYNKTHPAPQPPLLQVSCMLVRNSKDLSSEECRTILGDPEWVAEVKYDGCRAKLHIGNHGNRMDSRRRSVTTYSYNEITDNFPHFRDGAFPELAGTILDGELMMPTDHIDTGSVLTEGYRTTTMAVTNSGPDRAQAIQAKYGNCTLVVFDITHFKGRDIRDLTFRKRRTALRKVVRHIHTSGKMSELLLSRMYHSQGDPTTFTRLFDEIVAQGGEGLMLKNLNGRYSCNPGSRVKHQLKWKKMLEVDAIITGIVPGDPKAGFKGLVGAFSLSVHDHKGKLHEIGACQPGSLKARVKATKGAKLEYRGRKKADGTPYLEVVTDQPEPELADGILGRVVEVRYQFLTRNKRLIHCTLLRWRPDKGAEECEADWWKNQ